MAAPVFLRFALALASVQTSSGNPGGAKFLSSGSIKAEDLLKAMDEVLGCGGGLAPEHLKAIERALVPMWRTLPKQASDRTEWRSIRYLVHRYFIKSSSLLVRGFEPGKLLDSSDAGHAAILNNHVPTFIQELMDPARAAHGFSLDDAVTLVATIEQLMFDSESSLLEVAYSKRRFDTRRSVEHDTMRGIVDSYVLFWMVGESEIVEELLGNETLLREAIPQWGAITQYVEGRIRSLDYKRHRSPQGHRGHDLMYGTYSFDEAHEVVGSITKTFAAFWQSECQTMKSQLVAMDSDGFGHVRLSDFYGNGLDKDWRFGESEAYLRELGALDETSPSTPRVMVANYMQAASNCIVANAHYMVCCLNECESLLAEVEEAVGSPTASPHQILQLVGNMSSPSSPDGELPNLEGTLTSQLNNIAELHGGKVPLHGRLFSQWLHYVFPLECAFPHKTGIASYTPPLEYAPNGEFTATQDEMKIHAERPDADVLLNATTEDLWMQWSPEEELIVDYAAELHAPWEGRRTYSFTKGVLFFFVLAPLVVLGVLKGFVGRSPVVVDSDVSSCMLKHHLV